MGCNFPTCVEMEGVLEQWKMAISSILDAWLEHYSEDFHQPPEFPWLTKLLAYTRLNIPGSDMEQHAQRLLTQFRHLKPAEPEPGVEQPASATEQHPEPPQESTPATTMGPAETSGTEVFELDTAAGAECVAQVEMPAAESKQIHVVVTLLIHCPDLEESPAPLATPDEEQDLEPAIKVPHMLE
ncbi:unnamed protein product [Nyctereutes procyonoides]|uniref:(raccoon dog) hypothetical protein n=1 Tax=Nyctereutes procyonoides TaxID=34880 RepID=A0A811YVW3_NYCPR|nr:unnamed protein product [Nyctereutes procyonoides]